MGLTAEFGMGSGVPPSLETPGQYTLGCIRPTKRESKDQRIKRNMGIFRPPLVQKDMAVLREQYSPEEAPTCVDPFQRKSKNVQLPVRTTRLNALLHVHLWPIYPVVYGGAYGETQS